MTTSDRPLLALLIDADNISAEHVAKILKETHKLGNPYLRRVYADWSKPRSKSWAEVVANEGMEPVQALHVAKKKNGSDIRLVIDAMDLLHAGTFGGFVIVSSDSDFSSLAIRIRQHGIRAFGIGGDKAPPGLKNSFTKFVSVSGVQISEPMEEGEKQEPAGANGGTAQDLSEEIETLLDKAFRLSGPATKTTSVPAMGQLLKRVDAGYKQKLQGLGKLTLVIERSRSFQVSNGKVTRKNQT